MGRVDEDTFLLEVIRQDKIETNTVFVETCIFLQHLGTEARWVRSERRVVA